MKHTPCGNCPFRKDVAAYIRPERGREIRASLERGEMFPCHKTVDYSNDSDGTVTADSTFCGGALALLEKDSVGGHGAMDNQMVRWLTRLPDIKHSITLDEIDKATVPDSWDEWFAHLGEDQDTGLEYCDAAGEDCENPCGYGGYGGISHNEDPPACDIQCYACGHSVCGACSRVGPEGETLCYGCNEENE